MPSEPMLDALAAALVADLTAALPGDWRIRDVDDQAARALGVALYYEQGDIVTTINGAAVPTNYVGVEFTLTLAAPEEDPVKGRVRATRALLELLPALDGMPLLAWDKATRLVLTSGENAYRLEVVHLSRYTPPTMPEEA